MLRCVCAEHALIQERHHRLRAFQVPVQKNSKISKRTETDGLACMTITITSHGGSPASFLGPVDIQRTSDSLEPCRGRGSLIEHIKLKIQEVIVTWPCREAKLSKQSRLRGLARPGALPQLHVDHKVELFDWLLS